MRSPILSRPVSCVLILTLAAMSSGCTTTRVIAPEALDRPDYPKDRALKLTYPRGVVILQHVFVVDWPIVEGEIAELQGDVSREPAPNDPTRFRFDVSRAEIVEDYQFSRGRTTKLVLGIVGAAVLVSLIVVAAAIGAIIGSEGRRVSEERTAPREEEALATRHGG